MDLSPRSEPAPSRSSLWGLDWLNFFLADVQTGLGPFLAIYLAGYHWNEAQVGLALMVGSVAGILCQTPAGALVDGLHHKRALVGAAVTGLGIGSLVLALWPRFYPVLAAEFLIGGVSSVFLPAMAALALGLVGHHRLDARVGRNQAFSSAGNVFTAISLGIGAYYLSNRSIFFFVVILCVPTILALLLIKPHEIDYELARGSQTKEPDGAVTHERVRDLLKDKRLRVFCAASVLFHFANAAMLPLLGEWLSKGHGRSSALFMSACVVTTQSTIALIAALVAKLARVWGRKPVLLIGFGVLPIRGVLYTLVHGTAPLVTIQILDGIGAGIYGILAVLVVADLTRGTGRFNLAQGVLVTAIGIGVSLSQLVAGTIVHRFNYHVGFLFLASIAVCAWVILWLFMPETQPASETAKSPALNLHALFKRLRIPG